MSFFNLLERFYPNPGEAAPKETSATSSTRLRHRGTEIGEMILYEVHTINTSREKNEEESLTGAVLFKLDARNVKATPRILCSDDKPATHMKKPSRRWETSIRSQRQTDVLHKTHPATQDSHHFRLNCKMWSVQFVLFHWIRRTDQTVSRDSTSRTCCLVTRTVNSRSLCDVVNLMLTNDDQVPAQNELVSLERQEGKRPDWATLIAWAKWKPVAWDVTVPGTFVISRISNTAT